MPRPNAQIITDDDGNTIGDVQVSGIHGLHGGHAATLQVDLHVRLLARPEGPHVVLSQLIGELWLPTMTTTGFMLGRLCAPVTPLVHTQVRACSFDIPMQTVVPFTQLDAIEERRHGDAELQVSVWAWASRQLYPPGVRFSMPPPLSALPVAAPHPVYASQRFPVPQSEWIKVLAGAGYDRRVLVELRVPFDGQLEPDWQAVAKHMANAQSHFRNGKWKDAIVDVREAVDRVAAAANDQPDFTAAINQYDNGRTQMDLAQRWLFVRHALRHVTHLAHHGHNPDRHDANAAITIALALFERMRP